MKIIVLIKQVPDTWEKRKITTATGILDRDASEPVMDEINERALETALRYKDLADTDVVVLTLGPASATAMLRKALAMGADSALHVLDSAVAGADLSTTAAVLTAAIRRVGFDLVICGNESTDGRGGMMPAMLAEGLGVPNLTSLNTVRITADTVSGERANEYGLSTIEAPLPAVISVTETAPEARFASFKGIMKAKKKALDVWTLADLQVTTPTAGSHSVVLSTSERPARAGGLKVIDSGSAGVDLAEFLNARHLL